LYRRGADDARHSPDGSTFLREVTSFSLVWRQVKNRTPSIDARQERGEVFGQNITVKLDPDPIWKEGTLGFLKQVAATRKTTTTMTTP